jgi:hypothetical protein
LIGDKLISIIAIYTKSHMASDTPKDDGIISHPKPLISKTPGARIK